MYGIDIPTADELIANHRTYPQIAGAIGADAVFYNELADLEDAVRSLNPTMLAAPFDASCFNGKYVTPEVTPLFLQELENRRGRGRKDASFTPVARTTDPSPQGRASPSSMCESLQNESYDRNDS